MLATRSTASDEEPKSGAAERYSDEHEHAPASSPKSAARVEATLVEVTRVAADLERNDQSSDEWMGRDLYLSIRPKCHSPKVVDLPQELAAPVDAHNDMARVLGTAVACTGNQHGLRVVLEYLGLSHPRFLHLYYGAVGPHQSGQELCDSNEDNSFCSGSGLLHEYMGREPSFTEGFSRTKK